MSSIYRDNGKGINTYVLNIRKGVIAMSDEASGLSHEVSDHDRIPAEQDPLSNDEEMTAVDFDKVFDDWDNFFDRFLLKLSPKASNEFFASINGKRHTLGDTLRYAWLINHFGWLFDSIYDLRKRFKK